MNLAMSRTYGRSLIGERAYAARPYQRRGNATLIGAIALQGFLGAVSVDGGTNSDMFTVFIKQILAPCLWPGATVILDNLPAHKVKGI